MRVKRLLFVSLLLIFSAVFAGPVEDTAAFVAKMRSSRGSTYAMLNGVLQHRRSGKRAASMPLYVGLIIQPERTTGQIIINEKEGYLLGQGRGLSSSSIIPMQKSTELLDNAGIMASDLALAFIYDEVLKEHDEKMVSVVPCRVIDFFNAKSRETSRVYISKQHYFPLKAEFFRKGESKPWRTLEIDGFAQKNGLYYASRMRAEGAGWRTLISFDDTRCSMGNYDAGKPVTVVKNINR